MKLITIKKILASFLVASVFSGCVFVQQSKENQMITNKQKVVELLNSIENGNTKPLGYINPNKYIQHNLSAKDGLSGFGEVLSQLPKDSAKVEIKRVFEDGDFVFTHTKYNFFGPKVGFDIFRFEDGKIVEHWDTIEEILPKEKWLNNNGKF